MPTISTLPNEQLKPRAHAPAGGPNLIASFKNDIIGQSATSLASSAKEVHGEEASACVGVMTLYHGNQQYSVTALSDSSGNVSERYAYTAYGQPTFLNASGTVQTSSAAGNRYTYTGREWDVTLGLFHFRARWLSAMSGRFLSRDPLGYAGRSLGLYTFVRGRIFKRVDPSGLAEFEPPLQDGPVTKRSVGGGCWSRGGDDEERTYETARICIDIAIDENNCRKDCDGNCTGEIKFRLTYTAQLTGEYASPASIFGIYYPVTDSFPAPEDNPANYYPNSPFIPLQFLPRNGNLAGPGDWGTAYAVVPIGSVACTGGELNGTGLLGSAQRDGRGVRIAQVFRFKIGVTECGNTTSSVTLEEMPTGALDDGQGQHPHPVIPISPTTPGYPPCPSCRKRL